MIRRFQGWSGAGFVSLAVELDGLGLLDGGVDAFSRRPRGWAVRLRRGCG